MSDQHEQAAVQAAEEPAVPEAREPTPRPPRYRELALALAGALLLVLVLVGTVPFWAALLPWGSDSHAAIERLAAAQQQDLQRLEQRLAALEAKPPPAAPDMGAVRQQLAKLSAGIADLTGRLERVDQAMPAQGAADMAPKLDALDSALRTQAAAMAELGARIEKAEKAGQSRAAGEATEIGLVLALLQIRTAVEAGRPFAAEYEAFAALARSRPEVASAAGPLAEPAKTGVVGRLVLAKRLREMAPAIAAGRPRAAGEAGEPGWADAALEQLRGLVTIRRVEEPAPQQGGEAIAAAERALAGGDLAGAVAMLESLSGAPAASAAPWLRMARERLTVETALHRIESLLTAQLGGSAAAAGSPR